MTSTADTAAVIVAAGRGTRMGGGEAKQWRALAGQPVVERSLAAFRSCARIGQIVVVLAEGDMDRPGLDGVERVTGGASRTASVRAGLAAVRLPRVLIHDAARPLVPVELIERVANALDHAQAAAPGIELADALWQVADGRVAGNVPRDGLWRAQTPQGFQTEAIRAAHAAAAGDFADDVAVARAAGIPVAVVAGDERNFKLTRPEDFDRAERILRQES